MIMKAEKKTQSEVMEDGILPCGHPAEHEDDKIIIDHCFDCGWRTPLRAASDDLNDFAESRADAEQRLIDFVRTGNWTEGYESGTVIKLAQDAKIAFKDEERQRQIVKEIGEENPYPY